MVLVGVRLQNLIYQVYLNANGIGWNANLGYQFNEHIGAEVGYMSLPRVKNNGNTVVIKDNYAIDISCKREYAKYSDKLGVYGKVGVAQK